MSRQVYLLGWGLALVALAFLLTDAVVTAAGEPAELSRIRPGMTLRQAEEVMRREAVPSLAALLQQREVTNDEGVWLWGHREGNIVIDLKGGRVTTVRFERYHPVPSPLARLRTWLGW